MEFRNRKMSSYGSSIVNQTSLDYSQVLTRNRSFGNTQLPPMDQKMYLRREIKNLHRKQEKVKKRNILENIKGLSSLYAKRTDETKVTINGTSESLIELFQSMQKQQETMISMISKLERNTRKKTIKEPVEVHNNSHTPSEKVAKSKAQNDPLYNQYFTAKHNPKYFAKILEEHKYDYDEERIFRNAEKERVKNFVLSENEKRAIYENVKAKKEENRVKATRSCLTLKGKSLFRVAVFAILFGIFYREEFAENQIKRKNIMVSELQFSMDFYFDTARTWVLKAIRFPLGSILSEPNEDLNVIKQSLSTETKIRIAKIKVKARGIVDGLIEGNSTMDLGLKLFLGRFTDKGCYFPSEYLSPYEKSRLEFDQSGALTNQTKLKKQMLLSFLIISRLIIRDSLQHPETLSGYKITQRIRQ